MIIISFYFLTLCKIFIKEYYSLTNAFLNFCAISLTTDFGRQNENGASDDNSARLGKAKNKEGTSDDENRKEISRVKENYKFSDSMSDEDKSMPANLARGSAATGGGRGFRGIARLDECPNVYEGTGGSSVCEAFHICHSCVTVSDCEWHMDSKNAKCQKMKEKKHLPTTHLQQSAVIPIKNDGGSSKNVINIQNINHRKPNKTIEMKENSRKGINLDIGSNSDPDDNKPQPPLVGNSGAEIIGAKAEKDDDLTEFYEHDPSFRDLGFLSRSHMDSPCDSACSDRTTCSDCLQQQCMWCKNLRTCTDRNAYLASFPYGQCMDWTTSQGSCPVSAPKTNGKFYDLGLFQ